PNARPPPMACASPPETWVSSIAVAASPGSLRPVRGSANRPNRPQTPNCRVSSRSKVSAINPVEPVSARAASTNDCPHSNSCASASQPSRGGADHAFHQVVHLLELGVGLPAVDAGRDHGVASVVLERAFEDDVVAG